MPRLHGTQLSVCATGYLTGQVLLHPETPLHSVKAQEMGPRQSPQPIKPLRALCLVWVLICLLSKMSDQLQPDPSPPELTGSCRGTEFRKEESRSQVGSSRSGGGGGPPWWKEVPGLGRPGHLPLYQLTIGTEAGMQNLGKTIVYPMT